MKSFITGVISLLIVSLVSFTLKSMSLFNVLTSILGFGGLIISSTTSGNFSDHKLTFEKYESKEERLSRINLQINSFFFCIPSLVACILSLYVRYR